MGVGGGFLVRFAMCTITLELPDELAAKAQEKGLLSAVALESYIRKALGEAEPKKNRDWRALYGLFKSDGREVGCFLERSHADTVLEDELAGGLSAQ